MTDEHLDSSELSPKEKQARVMAEIEKQIAEAAIPRVHPKDKIILENYYGRRKTPSIKNTDDSAIDD